MQPLGPKVVMRGPWFISAYNRDRSTRRKSGERYAQRDYFGFVGVDYLANVVTVTTEVETVLA